MTVARPGRFDHLKPEVMRLIAENVQWGEIRQQYPDLPERTLANWVNAVKVNSTAEPTAEPTAKPPRPRLPIDPESPIEKIKNALWDIVYNPQGKGAAVQALNILLKIEAPWIAAGLPEPPPEDDDSNEVKVTREVTHAKD
jgi:hypothetical protein